MEVEAVKVWPHKLPIRECCCPPLNKKRSSIFEAEISGAAGNGRQGDEGGFRTMFDDSRAGVGGPAERTGRRRVIRKRAGKDKGVNTTNRLRRDTILREMKMRVF